MGTIVNDENIRIEKLTLGPYGTNTYVVVCARTGESLVVDAPDEADRVIELTSNTKPRYLLLTHGHLDHTGALEELKNRLKVPLAAHPADSARLPATVELSLDDGGTFTLGNLAFRALHTPGHTPGSLCFYTDGYLLAGDTIFPGGPGKTFSPEDFREIVRSITTKILTLPGETRILSGHGEDTTVEQSREEYAAFASRPHQDDLCGDVLWLTS